MKLTRRLLAVVLSVAMLIGMVAVGATASITDYYEYDPVNNPYTGKIGLKAYKVNVDDGTYTEITDGAVEPGDVVRVEIWVQTNYYHTLGSFGIAYSNGLYVPTTLEYGTYSYLERASSVSYSKVFAMTEYDEEHAGSADGTIDNPWYLNEVVMNASSGYVGKTKAQNYANIKKYMPPEWRGTGKTATDYYADEKYAAYNYLYAGYMADTNYSSAPNAMNGIIVTEYQPSIYFNLTVSPDAKDGDSGIISIPAEGIYTSSQTASTYLARCYSVDEDGDGIGDEEAAAAADGLQSIYPVNNNIAKDTYGTDTTIYERVYDMSEATLTLTVGGAAAEETTTAEPETEEPTTEEPATEEPTTVIEYANLDALKAAITAAKAADLENRTSATLKAYNEALAAAEALVAANPLLAQQGDVDAATVALNEAVSGLAYLGTCDYDALDRAIAAYEAKVNEKDNYSNWADYEAAYKAAKAVTRDMFADEAGANQATIDAAAKALNDVVLVPYEVCNYADYDAAVAAAAALVAGDYTTSSWAAADVAAVVAANEVEAGLLDKDGNQDKIDAAAAAINAAIAKLEKKADVSALEAAVAAEPKVAEAYATANTWAAYADAKAAAEALLAKADDLGESQAQAIAAAAAELNAANDALVEDDASYAVVDEAMAKVPADLSGYTADSVKALNEAIAAVQPGMKKSQQETVNAWAAAIEEAVKNLASLGTCDYTALDAQIKAYTELVKADYTPSSWTESGVDAAYEAAMDVARGLIADEAGANQKAIDDAAAALEAAIAKLDKVADKTALAAAIAEAKNLNEDDYTPDSWEAAEVEAAIAEAEGIYADADASDDQVAAAIELLEDLANILQKKADKSVLAEKIAAAKELKEENFTPDSWSDSDLEMIIEEAEGVYNNPNADATEVESAISALDNAVETLVAVADKAALKAAIDTEVKTENATSETLAAYEEALAAANEVYADANATQDAVNKAEADLLAAISEMKYLGGCDYAAYDAAVAAAAALVEDEYTTSSWTAADVAAVVAANEVAKDLVADEAGENQAKIDAAATAITEAIAKLEKKADVSALAAAVAAEPKVAEEYATVDTWTTYAQAKAEAERILANAADTGVSAQEAVDAATAALVKANEELVEALADYAVVEAAKAKIPADMSMYTAASVKAVEDAVAAVVEGLGKSKQDEVNAMAAAIEEAVKNLKENKSNIQSVEALFDMSKYMKKEAKDYAITVTGAPSKVQIKGQNGTTATYDRYHKFVKVVSYDAEGNEVNYDDVDPAYEVWTITMSLGEGPFTVKAKFGRTWDTEVYDFEVTMYKPRNEAVTFTAGAVDGEASATAISVKRGTMAEITVTAPTTVTKVQLKFASGTTATYTRTHSAVSYVDNGDGTATWTIARTFNGVGTGSMTLMLKDASGWYAANAGVIATEVTK